MVSVLTPPFLHLGDDTMADSLPYEEDQFITFMREVITGVPKPGLQVALMKCCGHITPKRYNGEYFCPWCWTYYDSMGKPIEPPEGWEDYDGYRNKG